MHRPRPPPRLPPASASSTSLSPSSELILRRLDHDSLFTCAFVCKAWRDTLTRDLAGMTPEVWRTRLTEFVDANSDALCALDKDAARKPGAFGNPMSAEMEQHERRKVRAYYAPLLAARTMCAPPESGEELHFMHVHSGLTPTRRPGPAGGTSPGPARGRRRGNRGADVGASASDPTDQYAALDPLALYKTLYEESCYDCREMKRAGRRHAQRDVEVHRGFAAGQAVQVVLRALRVQSPGVGCDW